MRILRGALSIAFLVFASFLLSTGCGDGTNEQVEVDAGCEDAFCIGTLFRTSDSPSSVIKAAELARDDINEAGGNIKLIAGDGATPLASTMELLEMGVKAIIGPGTSQSSVEIFDFLVENGLVAVSSSATSVTLTEKNREISQAGKAHFFFRTVPTDSFQAKILATEVRNGDEVLIVHRNDNYGVKLTELINREFLSRNRPAAKVVWYERYYSDDPMFEEKTQAVLDDIEAVDGIGNIGSIILILSIDEGGKIIKGMLDSTVVSSAARYYISDSFAVENLYERVDPDNPAAVEGFKSTTPCSLPDPPERKDEFEKRFDREMFPSLRFAVHAYDAVVAVALAALSAGSNDPSEYVSEMAEVTAGENRCLTYAECAAALMDETAANDDINYEGVSGPIEFDENGDIGAGCYSVYTYDAEGGRTRQVFSVPDLEDITTDRVP
ncbi:MAG: ABC transporter substrate-binding protein [Candidatus Dadabacteria bacterium]|nr:ABC transporter substrate-binding protein [Candidatus Dadabacteria bacterium]